MTSDISRRTIAKGIAWSVPAMAAATAAPAVAASQLTATSVTPQAFGTYFSRTPTGCNTTSNPQKGFIDTMCDLSPVTPPNSNGQQNPTSSNGFWLESAAGGTARIDAITVTYTFNRNIQLDSSPAPGTANTGTTRWTSPNILGPGWSAAQTGPRTIVATYTGSGEVETSTATAGSGFCTGYFLNYHVTEGCYSNTQFTIQAVTNMTYSTRNNPRQTWSKTYGPRNV